MMLFGLIYFLLWPCILPALCLIGVLYPATGQEFDKRLRVLAPLTALSALFNAGLLVTTGITMTNTVETVGFLVFAGSGVILLLGYLVRRALASFLAGSE